jgi:hypothetical protein
MNHPSRPTLADDAAGTDAFERGLRLHYWQATTQLSARTRAQLQQRLRAAAAPRDVALRSPRVGWSLAAACSLALVFGLSQRLQHDPMRSAPASIAIDGDSGDLVATLDETPDLYLWVASEDAATMTSE